MIDFHAREKTECLKLLKSEKSGLTHEEAKVRLAKYGKNELPRKKRLAKFKIFLNQLRGPLLYILIFAGGISLFLGHYIDAIVIFGAVFVNSVIGFFQENKANNALEKLKKIIVKKTLVMRAGQEYGINSSLVARGDVMILKAGNRVSADGRILESYGLLINESALTGESFPVEKKSAPVEAGAAVADRKSMVYAGTVIAKGYGKAVVCATGSDTQIGEVAKMVEETEEALTPLQERLADFSKFLGVVIVAISFLVVLIGILQGRSMFDMLIMGVALAVSGIPEGLVVAVTVILVLGMGELLKRKSLTRKLVAAETLGSTTVICSDKTGTLTEGNMQVSNIIIGENEFEIKTLGTRQDPPEAKAVSLALQASMMCNDAIIENPNNDLAEWKIHGSPTDSALLLAATQAGLRKDKILEVEPLVAVLPFESENKYMITLHKKMDGGYVMYEKGAPEKIIEKSFNFYHLGKIVKLTPKEKEKLNRNYENLTSRGLRVIAVAVKNINDNDFDLQQNDWSKIDRDLTFVGFIALKDPLRPEAKEMIREAAVAGVKMIIITGDHRLTAKAIAKEVGMSVNDSNVLSGEDLDKISDAKLGVMINKIMVYARVSPHHKLRIIRALQKRGEVVAMVGDGINDAPAIKAADVGISLGTGTDIAKESSDLVLLDNNFKTIVEAIFQGRNIFSNIRKVITYLISDSFSEIILIIGAIIFDLPLPLLPAQVLWINIINDGLPNFALAAEKEEKEEIMKQRPVRKDEPIINNEMKVLIFGVGIVRDVLIFIVFFWLFKRGVDIVYLRTIMFSILGFKSLASIFSLRSFKKPLWKMNFWSNHYLIFAVAASFSFLLAAIYLRPLQILLSTTPLVGFFSWMLVVCVGFASAVIIEIVKFFFTKNEKK